MYTFALNGAAAGCVDETVYDLCTNMLDCDNSLTLQSSAAHSSGTSIIVNKAIEQDEVILYLRAKTKGGKTAFKEIEFTVKCGQELVGLDDANYALGITGLPTIVEFYNTGLGTTFKSFNPADGYDFIKAFEGASTSDRCPVTEVKIYYLFNGNLIPWDDTSSIKISSNLLQVNIV